MRKSENTTDGMQIYDNFFVSHFRPPVVFLLFCIDNQKKRKHEETTKSNFKLFWIFKAQKRKYNMAFISHNNYERLAFQDIAKFNENFQIV
jgi:hypothetical protein